MSFYLIVLGYGFALQIGTYDLSMGDRVILAWSIIRESMVWRGERHIRSDYGYSYRCIKNGKDVEHISFRSPIVNHIR